MPATRRAGRRPRRHTDLDLAVADSKVGQLLALVRASGVPAELEARRAGAPGPRPYRPEAVLTGLLLAALVTGRATVADAWRLLFFCCSPRARAFLGLPEEVPDPDGEHASARRYYRALEAITNPLDPARCDRRRRLPLEEATEVVAEWERAADDGRVEALQRLMNRLVTAPVARALRDGALRRWSGDAGIDATGAPVASRPASASRQLGSVEVTAGWYFKGGATEGVFAYSASLLVAAHQGGTDPDSYPRLVLGLAVDSPARRLGRWAVLLLAEAAALGLPAGVLAADRQYTDQRAEVFQTPVRRLGWRLVLDFKSNQRGRQGSAEGAVLIDGFPFCPLIPAALAEATAGLDDEAVRRRPAPELTAAIAERGPYALHLKQGPDARGAVRYQCPALGASATLNCRRRDRSSTTPPAPIPAARIDLADAQATAAHPAARPTTALPEAEVLAGPAAELLPRICRQSSITLPADRAAKFRQDLPYLSEAWKGAFGSIRALNEGANSVVKGSRIDIGNPKDRPMRGRIGQHLALAVMVCAANLQILADWHHRRRNNGGDGGGQDIAEAEPETSGGESADDEAAGRAGDAPAGRSPPAPMN